MVRERNLHRRDAEGAKNCIGKDVFRFVFTMKDMKRISGNKDC